MALLCFGWRARNFNNKKKKQNETPLPLTYPLKSTIPWLFELEEKINNKTVNPDDELSRRSPVHLPPKSWPRPYLQESSYELPSTPRSLPVANMVSNEYDEISLYEDLYIEMQDEANANDDIDGEIYDSLDMPANNNGNSDENDRKNKDIMYNDKKNKKVSVSLDVPKVLNGKSMQNSSKKYSKSRKMSNISNNGDSDNEGYENLGISTVVNYVGNNSKVKKKSYLILPKVCHGINNGNSSKIKDNRDKTQRDIKK